jgi:cyclophilin family peptidyl-prolyl cis-trans isomerase
VQLGDIEHNNGSGGISAQDGGENLEDESYAIRHDRSGILGMVSGLSNHSNNS